MSRYYRSLVKMLSLNQPIIFQTQSESGGVRIRKLDFELASVAGVDTDSTNNVNTRALTIDPIDGSVYVGVGGLLEKFDNNLNHVWTYNSGAGGITGIAVDSNQDVIITKTAGGSGIRKIDSGGTLVWSRTGGFGTTGIFVDSNDDIYACFNGATNSVIKFPANNGSNIWTYNHGTGGIYVVLETSAGQILVGGGTGSSSTMALLNLSTGAVITNFDTHGALVYGIGQDSSGDFYSTGARISNLTTRKYDSAGNIVTSYDVGQTTNNGFLAQNDVFYICSANAAGKTIFALDNTLALVADFDGGNTGLSIVAL